MNQSLPIPIILLILLEAIFIVVFILNEYNTRDSETIS